MINTAKLEKVYESMKAEGVQYLILSEPSAINYLTGRKINPGERMMVFLIDALEEKAEFILSKLFPQEGEVGCPVTYFDDVDDYVGIVAEKICGGSFSGDGAVNADANVDSMECKKVMKIGVDKEWPAKFLLRLMELLPENKYINGSYILDHIRMIKDEKEQQLMIEASRYNDMGMEKLVPLVDKGLSENGLRDELLKIYLELGTDGFSFEPICCYGANAADPHHENNDATGKPGDSVILDIGCKINGYCADMTRTVFLGSVSEEQRKVYEIVKEANLRAIAAVKPGVRFCDVDAAARDYITEQGYGDKFVHRTGHSIGQDVHEFGDVSSVNTEVLKPGMVFSIEPGIYLTGDFGVRIEDLVLVTEDGCKVLNGYTKELQVIG